MNILKRWQKLNEMERMRRTLKDPRNENTCLKAKLQSADDQSATALKSKVEGPQEKWRRKKENICEKEHGGASDVNAKARYIEQTATLKKLQEDHQHITVYSKTLEKKVSQLEDEIRALREISKETQERQLSEMQPTSSAMQQHQRCAGTADELTPITAEPGRDRAVVKIASQVGGKSETFRVLPLNTTTKLW